MTNKRFGNTEQQYPEYMFKTDADNLRVFSWFVENCKGKSRNNGSFFNAFHLIEGNYYLGFFRF